MTAGIGIIHQEMPKGDENGSMYGKSDQIPMAELENGTKVRVICGKIGDKQGPVQDIVIDPEYLDITVPARSEFKHATKRGHTVIAYVIDGKGYFCQEKKPFSYEIEGQNYFDVKQDPFLSNGDLALFDDGDQVMVSTEKDPVRFLLVSGRPIGEPVAWYGPIVMNTRDELRIAFDENNNGTFIKALE
jgi:hypothetical protein